MKKSQFSHWVLPLATVCNMVSFSSAFAQEYDFSLHGYFNPSCGGGFFERVEQEGMPFQFDV
ncbi:hypothetical protein AB9F29_21935, partial [Falsihalocynthiibacter sp. S25ZX9]|uniref:hypothetical protein n=1 Tax=Falsihalocynthiibacter sp. S25ZX9 TaxID=3240870 RepID=UPI00350F8FB1